MRSPRSGSSGTGSGRKQPQWTNCTSSSRGIGVPIAGCSCRRDPRSMWGELAPPTAPQRRLCHGGGGWVFLCCLRSEFGGAVAQVGEPLVAGQQLSDLVGGLLVVEGLQQRPGEQLPLAQAQVAGLAQQHQHVAEVAAAEPPAEHDPQVVGVEPGLAAAGDVHTAGLADPLGLQEAQVQPAGRQDRQLGGTEVDHGRVVLQPRQRTAERGHPAVGPERVGELAAGLGQTAANLVANLFVGQLGYLGSGHRAGQEDPAELDGVQEAGSSRAGGSAAAGCSGAAVWGTATGTSSMRCSGPMGSGGSSEGSWTTRPRTPVWLATPTSSCPTGSIRGRGSREAIRLPSPIGPQRDHASTSAASAPTRLARPDARSRPARAEEVRRRASSAGRSRSSRMAMSAACALACLEMLRRAGTSPRSISASSVSKSASRTSTAARNGAIAGSSSVPAASARLVAAHSTFTTRSGSMLCTASTAQTAATSWASSESRQVP